MNMPNNLESVVHEFEKDRNMYSQILDGIFS